ncbi:hypothetical protein [Zhihengliuella halotolerans]|uniref:Uncharacterized protein n=1 Tax=Zhihengliuella halotolerans TaxID=370736 RepID=A0A4Q8AC70_9MICC|nr:hypothetical protein [Zhihengliuella halotolerans]RZU61738.1 hypothetical protein EV380_1316 [Zhihengliuella halotolerans]
MAKKTPRARVIRFDQFEQQLEETGIGNLQEVQLSKDESIWIRLNIGFDQDDLDEFQRRLRDCDESRDAALVILDYKDGVTAEEQLEKFENHGGTPDKLAALFASATAQKQEDLGKIRPRRS